MDISTFIKSLDNNDSVIIYGAGKMGQQVAACLKHLPKPVYPKCFSVSSGEEGTIDGIMVKRIGSIDNITTSLVILATSRIYHNDIVDTLQRIGVNNVFIMDNEMLDVLKREALSTMLRQMGIDVTLLKAVTNDLYSSLSMFQDETYNVSIRRAMRDIAGAQSAEFVINNMMRAKCFDNCSEYRRWILGQAKIDGLFLEFGVADGASIDFFSRLKPEQLFFGFDSFEGLPEVWKSGFEMGRFAQMKLPPVPSNVRLIKGWFYNTIPEFKHANNVQRTPISFIHIDCDIYSSTKCIFEYLADNFTSGTIIAFDEYFNYPSWQEHEHKAFMECVNKHNIKYEYLAYVENGNQVAIKINSIGSEH